MDARTALQVQILEKLRSLQWHRVHQQNFRAWLRRIVRNDSSALTPNIIHGLWTRDRTSRLFGEPANFTEFYEHHLDLVEAIDNVISEICQIYNWVIVLWARQSDSEQSKRLLQAMFQVIKLGWKIPLRWQNALRSIDCRLQSAGFETVFESFWVVRQSA
jgi:hypothetical protein